VTVPAVVVVVPVEGPAVAYWTLADRAELDCLVGELTRLAFEHRSRCSVCSQRERLCDGMRAAIEVVTDWRNSRSRLSRAAYLRAEQAVRDELALLGIAA